MTEKPESGEVAGTVATSGNGKKLMERAWDALVAAGTADGTARQYVSWMRDYVLFHGTRHPQEMGVPEVQAFLGSERFLGQAAQRVEATAAIRFLYEVVLQRRWPRGVLDRTADSTAHGSGGKPKAVYLNGRQPDVKLLDRVQNALRVGQFTTNPGKLYRSNLLAPLRGSDARSLEFLGLTPKATCCHHYVVINSQLQDWRFGLR
jgi:hypothetical protein